MVNVTITVPQELKDKMDKYSEVSWSEISRNAIAQYIAQRESPSPRIDLNYVRSNLNANDWYTGYPTLSVDIKVQNNSTSEMKVDRILAVARVTTKDGKERTFGEAYYLYRLTLLPNSSTLSNLRFPLLREKLAEIQEEITSTFRCRIECTVFADGYKNHHEQEVQFLIPIDVWNTVVEKALQRSQGT